MTAISKEDAQIELRKRLRSLENLNPDITSHELGEIRELASIAGEEFFDEAAEQTSKLMEMYLNSAIKLSGKEILQEYFSLLDSSAKRLQASGEIKQLPPSDSPRTFSTALVPYDIMDALDFCKLMNRTEMPKPLVKAADAFKRRNQIVGTVIEIALQALWRISPTKTESWIVQSFEGADGELDPDIVRDAISTTLSANWRPGKEFLEWAIRFASDQNLLEHWPAVTRNADRLICRTTLRNWFDANRPRSSLISQLKLHFRLNRLDDDTLLEWNKAALDEIGNCVQRFMSIERMELEGKWRATALASELKRIADLYVPVMLTADQLLDLPDGTDQFAMAFMGLSGKTRENWENSLEKTAFRAVRISLMLDLRYGRKPIDTIKRLTFGDKAALELALSELDLASENFDSIKQRDKVCGLLAVFYASYRRPQLLAYEIAKRYRNLMRLVHEDFLRTQLDAELFSQIQSMQILQEISSIASEVRKYLAKRKADENTLEQIMAAKINFERFVRNKRIIIAKELNRKGQQS